MSASYASSNPETNLNIHLETFLRGESIFRQGGYEKSVPFQNTYHGKSRWGL